ncbi:hypothetical protein Barb7_00371 [Bacteroidales bacterium Barb7]|nr:hypothetical protein Barb7_00371 [Bacteroidales bacterium Barb7]
MSQDTVTTICLHESSISCRTGNLIGGGNRPRNRFPIVHAYFFVTFLTEKNNGFFSLNILKKGT